ncbi:energy transducer TonB [Dysgonomonas massiliensis]|uniref:energy transducer TonB n=1 Tax=Dysgonomonas massiliensis TaxID=2040292 RepID=UPI000C756382|nr:energy transducer TonB [Dysgonomonas massiliensis]
MKQYFLLFMLSVYCAGVFAQLNNEDDMSSVEVDKMPFFLGGEDEMNRFIGERLFYPWKGDSIRGQVTCRFVVTKFGDIEDIEVIESLNLLADSITVNILRDMPRWIAATKNGVPVSAPMELSVKFDPERIPADRKLSKTAIKPSFPGGTRALSNYILRNLDSLDILPQDDFASRIMLKFIIDSEGKIYHPHILKSFDPILEAKVLEIVRQMPKWIVPEGDRGCYLYTLPISIRLQ